MRKYLDLQSTKNTLPLTLLHRTLPRSTQHRRTYHFCINMIPLIPLILSHRLHHQFVDLVRSQRLPLHEPTIFARSNQTRNILGQNNHSHHSIRLMHERTYPDVIESRIQKSKSPLPGSQPVIDQQPLNYLLPTLSPEFCHLTDLPLDYRVVLHPLRKRLVTLMPLSRH